MLTNTTKTINKLVINTIKDGRKILSHNTEIIGSDGETVYKVRVFKHTHNCTCKDWEMRGHTEDRQRNGCKHIKALRAAVKGTFAKSAPVASQPIPVQKSTTKVQKMKNSGETLAKPAKLIVTQKRSLGSRINFNAR